MSASMGNYSFAPYIGDVQYIYPDDDKYTRLYIAFQTIKKLLHNNMLIVKTPEELIETIESLIE